MCSKGVLGMDMSHSYNNTVDHYKFAICNVYLILQCTRRHPEPCSGIHEQLNYTHKSQIVGQLTMQAFRVHVRLSRRRISL